MNIIFLKNRCLLKIFIVKIKKLCYNINRKLKKGIKEDYGFKKIIHRRQYPKSFPT